MNDGQDIDPELDELRQSYRKIKAPTTTAARVVAAAESTSGSPARSGGGLRLAYAGSALIVGILALLPFTALRDSAPESVSMLPSLTALSRSIPDKPAMATPSLSSIRSVKTPAMPTRPRMSPMQDTQSYIETDDLPDRRKEENHEFV